MIIEDGILKKIEESDIKEGGLLEIPGGVTKISDHIIEMDKYSLEEGDLSKIIEKIIIPKSVTTIGALAFLGFKNMETVEFEENSKLKEIGASAFSGCCNLKTIEIPESTQIIGTDAFKGCSKLEKLIIPKNSVMIISDNSFDGLENLKEIYFEGNLAYDSLNEQRSRNMIQEEIPVLASNIGSIITVFDMELVGKINANRKLQKIKIPEHVEIIGQKSFAFCSSLKSIMLPDNLKTIENCAFMGCNNLNMSKFPNTLETIDDLAFAYCFSLESIEFPNSIKKIGESAFGECSGLKEIKLPNGIDTIENYTFYRCSRLNSVKFPEKIKKIKKGAFGECINLGSISIPEVSIIEDYAFCSCSNLENVNFSDNLKIIGDYAFFCCEKLPSITIPGGITKIGEFSFRYNDSLKIINIVGEPNEVCKKFIEQKKGNNIEIKYIDDALKIEGNKSINDSLINGENIKNMALQKGVADSIKKAEEVFLELEKDREEEDKENGKIK